MDIFEQTFAGLSDLIGLIRQIISNTDTAEKVSICFLLTYIAIWWVLFFACVGAGGFYVKRGASIKDLPTCLSGGIALLLAIVAALFGVFSLVSISLLASGAGFTRHAGYSYKRAVETAALIAKKELEQTKPDPEI